MVRESQRGFALDPLRHGAVTAHYAVHVPIGDSIFEGDFAEGCDGHAEGGVGFPASVGLPFHVGRPDEYDVRIGVRLLYGENLACDELLYIVNIGCGYARNHVSAIFHHDKLRVHRLVRFCEEFWIDSVENRSRGTAHGYVVDGHAVGSVCGNGVNFGISRERNLYRRRCIGEFPRIYVKFCVRRIYDRRFGFDHLDRSLDFFRTVRV